jgi:hydroxycarboxylate dehydrogenase B
MLVPPEELREIATAMFTRLGSPLEESRCVAESLVLAALRGYDSHGIMRIPQYVAYLKQGQVAPGAPFEILHESASTAHVDGNYGWGQVVARKAMALAVKKAKEHSVGTVVVRNSQHVNRLGEYPAIAAEAGMIGLAIINLFGGTAIEEVAPWGGLDPKMAPNPIAWSAPSGHGWPIVSDMTTSVVPEGKVRLAKYRGERLPDGCLIDSDGKPTTDPAKLYGPPPGALLPLGGLAGHKGFGLALLTEILGGALSGGGCVGDRKPLVGNGLFFQAIRIESFVPLEEFLDSVRRLRAWIKSSRLERGVAEIFLPGERAARTEARRRREGIPVEDRIWTEVCDLATELGVAA